MSWAPYLLGAALGAGTLLIVVGLRKLSSTRLDEAARKRGFWLLNGGVLLSAVSIYLMTRLAAG